MPVLKLSSEPQQKLSPVLRRKMYFCFLTLSKFPLQNKGRVKTSVPGQSAVQTALFRMTRQKFQAKH